jgi:GT2 family glycosyltransferase
MPWRQDQAAISPARVWIYALACSLEFITMSRVPGTGTPIYTAIHQRSGHAAQRERGEVVPEKALVSFVVIAYNEAHSVAQTLAAITQLEDLGQYEVIVVDDGSRDTTAKIVTEIAAYDTHVRLVSLEANRGRGHARHRGVAAARGALIAMVDADITLPSDWLIRTRAVLERHDAAGGTAVPDGDVAYVHRRFRLVPRVVHATTTVTGNNGLYRREVFDVIDFNPELREGEDVALNYAMDRHGLSSASVPGLLVSHQESKSLGASLRWLFDSGRGATRQLVTYHQLRQPDLAAGAFAGTMALGAYLAVRRHRMIGAALPVGFVVAASTQHMRSRFEVSKSPWTAVASAIAVDGALLTAYFAGRLAGLAAVWRGQARTDSVRS